MTRLNIDTGTEGNSATGDTLRTAMTKINTNFEEVYQIVGDPDTGLLTTSLTNGDIKVQPNGTGVVEIDQLQITDAAITSLVTNGDVTITANGTGDIILGAVTIADNKITTNTSNDNLQLDANGTGAIEMIPAVIMMANLPTSDPSNAGQLWNDSGDLKVSAG
tara:strand:- start:336 stop:824 length:489 start_codon:yes stop_codon:yes gene_type:complete